MVTIGLRLSELKSEFIADFNSAPFFVGSVVAVCGLVVFCSLWLMAMGVYYYLTQPPYRPPLPPRCGEAFTFGLGDVLRCAACGQSMVQVGTSRRVPGMPIYSHPTSPATGTGGDSQPSGE